MTTKHDMDDRQFQIVIAQAFNLAQQEFLERKLYNDTTTDAFTPLLYKYVCKLTSAQKVFPQFFLQGVQTEEEALRAFVKEQNPLPKVVLK